LVFLPHSGISVFAGEFHFLGKVRCSDFPLAGVAGAGVTVDVSFFFPGDLSFATFGVEIGALVSVFVPGCFILRFVTFGVDIEVPVLFFFFSGAFFFTFCGFRC
jgi:hypothetical protein